MTGIEGERGVEEQGEGEGERRIKEGRGEEEDRGE